jgi:hypothetical protein
MKNSSTCIGNNTWILNIRNKNTCWIFVPIFRNAIPKELNRILESNDKGVPDVNMLTGDLHMVPDFHGNRSPLADATRKGMVNTDLKSLRIKKIFAQSYRGKPLFRKYNILTFEFHKIIGIFKVTCHPKTRGFVT